MSSPRLIQPCSTAASTALPHLHCSTSKIDVKGHKKKIRTMANSIMADNEEEFRGIMKQMVATNVDTKKFNSIKYRFEAPIGALGTPESVCLCDTNNEDVDSRALTAARMLIAFLNFDHVGPACPRVGADAA
ncbi:hypothetical protein AAMO2058_001296700 [Amorphochlora amoebiformis]|eukprot:1342200-Amorphochlora_amoeboformis.AAC.1